MPVLAASRDLPVDQVVAAAETSGDADLERIALEYLPLTFSRRHGDPSRPWNRFSIDIRNDDGSEKLYYQGNWRDIFQNWEALALSYPEYLESFVTKFVNASTADGYNPYRITRDGFEWEDLEPASAGRSCAIGSAPCLVFVSGHRRGAPARVWHESGETLRG